MCGSGPVYAGGLQALQTTVILSAAPFIFVILALAVAIVMLLRRDPLVRPASLRGEPDGVATAADDGMAEGDGGNGRPTARDGASPTAPGGASPTAPTRRG